MPERRLAIAIKGGVSLGSYEAGVISETLYLLGYNNQTNSTKWYIDALAGASAGGMTSAILAMILLNSPLAGVTPDDPANVLRKVWVDEISLDVLDPANGVGLSKNFIFASGAIDKLAGDYVKFPHNLAPHGVLRDPHSVAGGSHIALALTHSRLGQGLLAVPTFTGSELFFNEHAASSRFDIRVKDSAGALSVEFSGTGAASIAMPAQGADLASANAFAGMLACAIACGAFPFAFAARGLALRDDQKNWSVDYFTDGGLYDNDPVGQAINLGHEIDWSADASQFSDTERRFFMIEPEPGQGPDGWPPSPKLVPGTNMLDVDALQMIGRIVGGAIEEIQQSGLRGIPEVNRRIKIRQDLVARLEYQLHTGSGNFTLPPWLPDLVNEIGKAHGLTLDQMNYFRKHFVEDLEIEAPVAFGGARGLPPDRSQLFVELGLLLDLAIDVADKVAFEPILVTPATELAGAPLYAFKGFFDVGLRMHDFMQGVSDALDVWRRVQQREGRAALNLPKQIVTVPVAPNVDDSKLVQIQKRMEIMLNAAVDDIQSTTERLAVKALIQWQVNFYLGMFLKTLK